jgi:two-component system sensor histidine kinase SenX3
MATAILDQDPAVRDLAPMEHLRRNVRRVRFLVDGVLRLERFQPEELPVSPEDVQPAGLVDSIMSDLNTDARQKGLRFEHRISRTLCMSVDRDLFVDAMGNLIQNAVRNTARGSVLIDADEDVDSVVFRVRDTGAGIPEDLRPHILRELVRPGAAGGNGIGLLVAQRAVAAQGGEIGFESEIGRGSNFWVRLPRHVAARNGRETPIGDSTRDTETPKSEAEDSG